MNSKILYLSLFISFLNLLLLGCESKSVIRSEEVVRPINNKSLQGTWDRLNSEDQGLEQRIAFGAGVTVTWGLAESQLTGDYVSRDPYIAMRGLYSRSGGMRKEIIPDFLFYVARLTDSSLELSYINSKLVSQVSGLASDPDSSMTEKVLAMPMTDFVALLLLFEEANVQENTEFIGMPLKFQKSKLINNR